MNQKELSVLIDHLENLKSEDLKERIAAISHLNMIAEAFGPDKTINTLLPFLKEFKDDEEDVMLILAKQFKYIGKLIAGKNPDKLAELIPHFYICLTYEDMSVNNQAFKSMKSLAEKFNFKHESFLLLAKKLY